MSDSSNAHGFRFATKTLHAGQGPQPPHRSVSPPIYQSATFGWEGLDEPPEYQYTRYGNPTRHELQEAIAALEDARHCLAFGSGVAAISGAFDLLEAGDGLLMASDIYGGTFNVAQKVLSRRGIEVGEFDARDPASLHALARPNTKMVVFESPTNPNLRVLDIGAVTREARALGLTTVFDNTFASPALQNPLALGVDVVVHSTTKYISGHSDVIGGALLTNDDELYARAKEGLKVSGPVPGPFDCWLALRGLRTLALRMKAHCANAQAVAEFLEGHPKVARVHYPGLPSHPDHELAKRQMRGFGGMLAVEVDGPPEAAHRLAERSRLFRLAASLGGVESLVAYPPKMSHAGLTEEQRLQRGIPPTMLRLSVGIEDAEDLVEDLAEALAVDR